jgi:hypothetical protein
VLHVALVLLASLSVSTDPPAPNELPQLDLSKLYVSNGMGIHVAPEVEALAGHRIRVVGYLARMEEYVPRGAVYLTRLPVETEEGGGGTGDLPPGALRVEVPRLAGEEIEWVPGAVEVIGTLQVGRAEDEEGRVSWLRVVVDDPPSTTKAVR